MSKLIKKSGLIAVGAAMTVMSMTLANIGTVGATSGVGAPDVVPTNTPVPPATSRPGSTPTPQPPGGQYANVTIGKNSNPSLIPVGGTTVFYIGLRCDGNVPCNDVMVYDTLPSFMQVVSVSPDRAEWSTGANQSVTVRVGQMRPMEVLGISIVARAIAAGSAFNEARVTASHPDNPNDNYARAPIAATSPQPVPPPPPPPPPPQIIYVPAPAPQPRVVTRVVYVPLPRTGEDFDSPVLPILAGGIVTVVAGVIARRRRK
jgi:uncharacterized repeat protein (TIGR01451 family)/LPXTG-motif cell wall-anchored protein